jgi:hypothetical protein
MLRSPRSDDHGLHGRAGAASRVRGSTAAASRPAACQAISRRIGTSMEARPQLVNRRMRTLRISPNAAKVAMSEDPP